LLDLRYRDRARPERTQEHRVDSTDPVAVERVAFFLRGLLAEQFPGARGFVVLCIGTDRSTGDCLGPLIGTELAGVGIPEVTVWGTLDHPVHASNLNQTLRQVDQFNGDRPLIAIDACLGSLDSVGMIALGVGPLRPGAGVNKALPEVGNLYVTGVVNVGGFMEYFVLQNTRLNLVFKMARVIAAGLATGLTAAIPLAAAPAESWAGENSARHQ
jgi:putative sporulation protein YyaC